MKKVVFVSNTASKLNIDTDIPFVGAKCFNTIVKWIKFLEVDYYVCFNSDKHYNLDVVRKLKQKGFKVIALGNYASKRLNCAEIEHLKIDHPSGLNRKLNNKTYVNKMLQEAKDYVNLIETRGRIK